LENFELLFCCFIGTTLSVSWELFFFAVTALDSSICVVISGITDRRGLFMDFIVLFSVATYVVDRRGSLRDSWLFLLVVIDYGVLIHSFVAFPFKVLG
jgi:hypothetical protein